MFLKVHYQNYLKFLKMENMKDFRKFRRVSKEFRINLYGCLVFQESFRWVSESYQNIVFKIFTNFVHI